MVLTFDLDFDVGLNHSVRERALARTVTVVIERSSCYGRGQKGIRTAVDMKFLFLQNT